MRRGAVVLVAMLAARTAGADRAYDDVIALQERGELSQALVDADVLLAKRPNDGDLLLVRGDLLATMNRLAEARATLEQAFAIAEPTAAWLELYGRTLDWLGDHEAAQRALERAVALDPDNAAARDQLAHATRIVEIAKPGGQPPADSVPARVVDELCALGASGQLAHGLLEHLDPTIFAGIEAAYGDGKGPSLRDHIAQNLDAAIAQQKAVIGNLVGYRITDATTRGETATVTAEVAATVMHTAAEVDEMRKRIAATSAIAELGSEYGRIYDRLSVADRDRYLTSFIGRRETTVETLRFELVANGGRWSIKDLHYTERGIERSLVGELHSALSMSVGLYKGLAEVLERHAPPTGWHWLDVLTLAGTLVVLAWLAIQLMVWSSSPPREEAPPPPPAG